jgi:3-hydroxyacyl-CoA dehydrogenase
MLLTEFMKTALTMSNMTYLNFQSLLTKMDKWLGSKTGQGFYKKKERKRYSDLT